MLLTTESTVEIARIRRQNRRAALTAIVGRALPGLSPSATSRLASMAETMKVAVDAADSCSRADLLRAGYSVQEVDGFGFVALDALAEYDAALAEPLPAPSGVSLYSPADHTILRSAAARRRRSQFDALAA